jgi:NAD(P)-dependent dehydrogenase (short-subunit alcohol dehydrogenase family)
MSDMKDRVVLITGAAGNLGQATAGAFRRAGARTMVVDRSPDRLAEIYPDAADSPDHVLAAGIDLTDPEAVDGLAQTVRDRWGRIDALVNTVGTFRGGKPVHEEPLETWDFLFRVNVRTTLLTSRAVIPLMLEQGGGRIVNVASRNALQGDAGVAAYSATKSAVVRLTESLAAEVRASSVNVNAVLPGTIDTPENRRAMPDADFDSWVSPEAIADVIVFLASDAARGITGATLPIYGRG